MKKIFLTIIALLLVALYVSYMPATNAEAEQSSSVESETTENLSDMVSNILKLNKIENRNIMPEKREFDLCRQLSDCLLEFENVWEEKEIEREEKI